MKLAVNIDHIATVREARGEVEPEPVIAAGICELAGAEGIVCHLREDRRHINDRDVRLLREVIRTKMNLEMAATEEMVKIACEVLPDIVTLVPEKREEVTTEGGLDIIASKSKIKNAISKLHDKDIKVSVFIEPELDNLDEALEVGADIVEIHTGKYSNLTNEQEIVRELSKIGAFAMQAQELGFAVSVGHGLNYYNVFPFLNMPEIAEANIGHSIISRALYSGLHKSVEDMVKIIGGRH
jgi:pyridoxine 5-phosphate synthase